MGKLKAAGIIIGALAAGAVIGFLCDQMSIAAGAVVPAVAWVLAVRAEEKKDKDLKLCIR